MAQSCRGEEFTKDNHAFRIMHSLSSDFTEPYILQYSAIRIVSILFFVTETLCGLTLLEERVLILNENL